MERPAARRREIDAVRRVFATAALTPRTTLRFDRRVRALVAGAGVVLIAFGAPVPGR